MGFFVQPVFVGHKIAVIYSNIKLHCIASLGSKTLAPVLGTVSLTTLTAISIDRLLALVFSVSYCTVVTIRVTAKIVVLLWLLEITLSVPLFIDPVSFLYSMIFLLVLYLRFSNSLIIHALMTQSDCFNSVRCMDLDTQ